MEDIADLKLKLDVAKSCLEFISDINNKKFDNIPSYVKIRMCRENANIGLEALKLQSTRKHKIGVFENIPSFCPWCKAEIQDDFGTSVAYKCGNTASRLNGVTYKHCQFDNKI